MKTYRNNKGITIYEREESYAIALQVQGEVHYATLFHKRTDIKKRGFWEEWFPRETIRVCNPFFENLVKTLEADREGSNKRKS